MTKYYRPGGFIFSRFWRLEVQDQGVNCFDAFRGYSPWSVDDQLLPVSECCLSSPHFCVQIYSSYKIRAAVIVD